MHHEMGKECEEVNAAHNCFGKEQKMATIRAPTDTQAVARFFALKICVLSAGGVSSECPMW
jgi:hypothetical protein